MTTIGFYILPDSMNRMQFLSKLTEQLYRGGTHCHIHAGLPQLADRASHSLWTGRDISFIPHERLPSNEDAVVTIGVDEEPKTHDVLINISTDIPSYFSQFEKVVEIIDPDPELKSQGREHYKFYQDRGYPIENHHL